MTLNLSATDRARLLGRVNRAYEWLQKKYEQERAFSKQLRDFLRQQLTEDEEEEDDDRPRPPRAGTRKSRARS